MKDINFSLELFNILLSIYAVAGMALLLGLFIRGIEDKIKEMVEKKGRDQKWTE